MRKFILLLLLGLFLSVQAEDNDFILHIQHDSIDRFDEKGDVIPHKWKYRLVSDDSSVVSTVSCDTSEWKDGYFRLNFGPASDELTYIVLQEIDASDDSWSSVSSSYLSIYEWHDFSAGSF